MENFEFLKERAKEFWERGFKDFEKKRLNLSAFDFEQAMQMWVKYLIGKKIGDWPKTHYFHILIKELANSYDNIMKMKFFSVTLRMHISPQDIFQKISVKIILKE
jgi:HEPN domain-containing protein